MVARKASHLLTYSVLAALLVVTTIAPFHSAEAAVSSWQQKGISMYPTSPTDFASAGYRASVDHYKSLGANTVTLVVQLYQSNDGSTDIGPGGNTPSDAALTSAIHYAHTQGMQVMLDIHLDTYDGVWRANINPNDRAGWYANYAQQLIHYGQLAAANGVEAYCLGTELIDMSSAQIHADNTQEWQTMIAKVRQVYTGKLTYDANWGGDPQAGEARFVQFWSSLDFIGISGYYPLSGDGSVAQDKNAWASWDSSEIQPLAQKWNKPILFTEIGYRSVTNAHSAPYDSGMSGSYDAQEQVHAYQALFEYWNTRPYMQGIDAWYATSATNTGGAGDTDYLVQGKPAEQTLSSWWQGSGTQTPPSGPPAAYTINGTTNASAVPVGQSVTSDTSIKDTGGAAWGTNIDLEVYDASGKQVAQKVVAAQDFTAGQTKQYSLIWTPAIAGTYTFKVGVFDSNWKLSTWNDAVATITAGSTGSVGGGASSGTTDIWWPASGGSVSGVQPFKALLENRPLSAYSMYWQVDGGTLNLMQDSQTDYPHKEVLVDVGSWNWRGNGPYVITFVSKDSGGTILSQKSVSITTTH
jgi:hypothetical protein